ncbi:MAG: metalloregulator ArsR/SmtB family transcription factor [Spirochaetia bacterium]|nr:metalloregulator ArsR/SmtB family transcription factor [Spirochaetia bacterium]
MQSIDFIKTFSEPLRIRILLLLKEASLSVSEIVSIIGQSQSNISHHIKMLKDGNLIKQDKQGSINLYSLIENPEVPSLMRPFWDNFSQIGREVSENSEDMRKLILVLSNRQNNINSLTWADWRKAQPDLPYTAEVAFAGMPRNETALDIGCGDGTFLAQLKENFTRLYGIDISLNQINEAKKNISENIFLLNADANDLPFQEKSIESVYLRMVLGFIPKPVDALKEALRILKPMGRVSIIDKYEENIGKENSFSFQYFQTFCGSVKNCKLLFYKKYPKVFVCAIEKEA